jgi:hypothetical protein
MEDAFEELQAGDVKPQTPHHQHYPPDELKARSKK